MVVKASKYSVYKKLYFQKKIDVDIVIIIDLNGESTGFYCSSIGLAIRESSMSNSS